MSSKLMHEFISDAEIIEEVKTKSDNDKNVEVEDAVIIDSYDPYDFVRYFSILGF